MKKASKALAAALALGLLATVAHAITYGVHDDGEHPYVGFLLFFDPVDADGPGWFSCTGTLLDPTTVLSAGHCTSGIGTGGAATPGGSGGNDVWVSFDESVDLSTWPKRADYPDDEAGLYAARAAWLNANPRFTRATSYPHPSYNDFADAPANHDVGVVVLDEPSSIHSYGVLAPIGTLDKIARKAKNHNKVLIESAGYGIQSIKPRSVELDERWKATSTIVNLTSALTDGWNIHSSNNPSPQGGRGGTCFGDSGGGVFLNDTNVVVGVVSFGINNNCKGSDYSARADIADTQDFVAGFLGN